jgi:hypothetical protein
MNNTFTALNRSLEQNTYNFDSYNSLPIKNNLKEPEFNHLQLNQSLESLQEIQEPFQPVKKTLKLLEQTIQPVRQIIKPVRQIIEQTIQPVRQIVQPVQQIIEPVRQIVQPVQQIIEPVQQIIEQTIQPEQQIIQPGQQPDQSVQPVLQQLTNQLTLQLDKIQQLNQQLEQNIKPIIQIKNVDINDGLPDIECNKRIDVIKKDLSMSIAKYIDLLCDELFNHEIISINEIKNIKYKIKNNEVDNNTIINYLENKKKLSRNITISKQDKSFDNLISGKWQVPMPRPPVCLPSDNTKINHYDLNISNFSSF